MNSQAPYRGVGLGVCDATGGQECPGNLSNDSSLKGMHLCLSLCIVSLAFNLLLSILSAGGRSAEETDENSTQMHSSLPFESFGLKSSFWPGALQAILLGVGPALSSWADFITESLVVCILFVPLGLYYIVRLQLARMEPEVGCVCVEFLRQALDINRLRLFSFAFWTSLSHQHSRAIGY